MRRKLMWRQEVLPLLGLGLLLLCGLFWLKAAALSPQAVVSSGRVQDDAVRAAAASDALLLYLKRQFGGGDGRGRANWYDSLVAAGVYQQQEEYHIVLVADTALLPPAHLAAMAEAALTFDGTAGVIERVRVEAPGGHTVLVCRRQTEAQGSTNGL